MFGGANRLVVAAAVMAGAVIIAPPAALACGGGPSAVNVYKECAVPSGGGGSPAGTGTAAGGGPSSALPNRTLQALAHAGKDRRVLSALVRNYGLQRHLQAAHASDAAAPSTLGSVFDLSSGPTVLLLVLAGTAALLLSGSGMRAWRGRHRA